MVSQLRTQFIISNLNKKCFSNFLSRITRCSGFKIEVEIETHLVENDAIRTKY